MISCMNIALMITIEVSNSDDKEKDESEEIEENLNTNLKKDNKISEDLSELEKKNSLEDEITYSISGKKHILNSKEKL